MTSPRARFFDLSLDLLATANVDGYFVDLNQMWEKTLGYAPDELRQKPFIEFVHPDDREATLQEASKLFKGHVTIYFENRYLAKDGSYRWLSWNSRVSEEDKLIIACARDITEQKLLQLEKEQAFFDRDRFKALADNTSDFVSMSDLEGRATYVNRAGRRLLGAPELDVATLRLADCHPPEYGARVINEGLPHAAAHGVWSGDGLLSSRDGRTFRISQVIVALRDSKGQVAGFGTIIRDLTDIDHFKKLEQELRTQESALREMLHAMATPIIPITEHIVVMPLIGAMDSFRAEQFLDAALQGAELRRAQIVIIDITGLRHIDTSVAGTLVKTSAALRLLGAHVVLTGIRAEIARTLVGLGVELSTLKTHSTLQSGITYALRFLGEGRGRGR
jgi:rsbT co-antagonist protein RsbR